MSHQYAEQIAVPSDEWFIEILVDHRGQGRHYAYTIGLADLGIPEMYIGPGPLGAAPRPEPLDDDDLPHELTRRAQWLCEMAGGALAGTVSTGQVQTTTTHSGQPVRFWMAPAEPPSGIIAVAIPDEPLVVPVRWSLSMSRFVGAGAPSE